MKAKAVIGRGFTLVECMVTLAVLVVLVTVAMPSFVDFFDRHAVRGAADHVVSLISDARAEAVKSDLDVSVAMAGSGTAWCIGANSAAAPSNGDPAATAGACDCTNGAECLVSGQHYALDASDYPGVQLASTMATLTFDRQMGVVAPLGAHNLTLTSPRGKYDVAVEVNALGQARVCVPTSKPSMTGVPSC